MRTIAVNIIVLLMGTTLYAEVYTARPGDDLQKIVNTMRPGDELHLEDGRYEPVWVDFRAKSDITVRAKHVVPVTISTKEGFPYATGGKVVLSGKGRRYVFRGGTNITLRGLVIDGCSNLVQQSAVQCFSGWTVEDCIIQNVDTSAISISGFEDRRAKNITFRRVVAQDNGYIGIGGGFADHVRISDCGSFRNNRGWHFNAFGEHGYQKNGKWYAHAQWEAGGGKFAVCDDVIVERHWAEGNNGPGLWFDWRNTNITVRDSMFINQVWTEFDYDALGMQVEINPGPTLIENCLFQGNVGGINVCEDQNVTIRDCHFTDGVWSRNLEEGSGYRNNGVQDLTVAGNTFYGEAKINLWGNMDAAYQKKHRITIAPNKMSATPPVTWKVEGLPTPPPPSGLAAPVRIFGTVQNGVGVSNGWGPIEIDQSVGETDARDGRPMSIGGQKFERGIGVHAPFVATYELDGRAGTFRAQVGIDDEVGKRGSATFEVWLDDAKASEVKVRGGEGAKDVSVDVSGKKKLTLRVNDAGDGKQNDHVSIVDPRVE